MSLKKKEMNSRELAMNFIMVFRCVREVDPLVFVTKGKVLEYRKVRVRRKFLGVGIGSGGTRWMVSREAGAWCDRGHKQNAH